MMDTAELQKLVVESLEDHKAIDITVLDVRELTQIMDTMIICSGTSKRHLQTLGEHVVKKAKENGVQPLGIEGENTGEWVLVDLVDIVVQIMMPEVREFYSLEKLWSNTEKIRRKSK